MPRMSARAAAVFLAGLILLGLVLSRLRPNTDDVSAVRQAENRLDQASAQGDVRILESMIGSDFSTVGAHGNREDRSEYLDRLRANPWKIESLRQEHVDIHFYSGLAVVTGEDQIQSRGASGQFRGGAYRFLHVFQKRDGRWLLIGGMGPQFEVQ